VDARNAAASQQCERNRRRQMKRGNAAAFTSRGCLVQKQQPWVGNERPSDGNALSLSPGELAAKASNLGVVPTQSHALWTSRPSMLVR
jgi:hypothetical protein